MKHEGSWWFSQTFDSCAYNEPAEYTSRQLILFLDPL